MNKKIANIFTWLLIIILICAFWPSKSIAKMIDNDSKFKYSTSITSHFSNSDRAQVYVVNMTVPQTAKYISEKKKPYSHTDYNNQESIQLDYDDYYIIIYKGEESKTYVQISSKKYIHYNGYSGLYRPLNRNIILFFDRTYTNYSRSNNNRYGKGYTNTYNNTTSNNTTNSTNKASTKNTSTNKTSNSTKNSSTINNNTTTQKTTDKNSSKNQNNTNKINTNTHDSNKIRTNNNNSSKIKTNNNNSSKIRTNNQSSSKIKNNSSSQTSRSKSSFGSSLKSIFSPSARSSSVGSRSRLGGGISFGK